MNYTVQRFTYDRIIRGFDDRREDASGNKLACPIALHASLNGDVTENQHASGNVSHLITNWRGAVIDRTLVAVFLNEHGVVREADNDSITQCPGRRVVNRLTGHLVDDSKHGF